MVHITPWESFYDVDTLLLCRQTYGDSKGFQPFTLSDGDSEEEAEGQTGGPDAANVATSPTATLARTPSRQKDDIANKAGKVAEYYGAGPPKLTPQSVLEFAAECYGNLWSIMLRNGR